MQTAEHRDGLHPPDELGGTRDRLMLGEGLVRTRFVVEADELGNEMAEVVTVRPAAS
jgi:hypothetical protein